MCPPCDVCPPCPGALGDAEAPAAPVGYSDDDFFDDYCSDDDFYDDDYH